MLSYNVIYSARVSNYFYRLISIQQITDGAQQRSFIFTLPVGGLAYDTVGETAEGQ